MIERMKQRGMSAWSMTALIMVVIFFGMLFFKLLPVYISDAKVSSALSRVSKLPNARSMSSGEIVDRVSRQFDIDMVTNVKAQQVQVVPTTTGGLRISLEYDVEVPMLGNVSAVVYFNHEYDI